MSSAKVIPFRPRVVAEDEEPDIDLATAVAVAIRDLRDIAPALAGPSREQADACRKMLERALVTEYGPV